MPSPQDINIKNQIKILNKYLENPTRLYTGLEAKKYWKNNVFSYNEETINSAVKSGRWSAYGHYSLQVSFNNILKKHDLAKNSHVLVHPLCEKNIVEELVSQGYQISSTDIQKETLHFDPKLYGQMLEESSKAGMLPELVIIPSHCGLGKELEKIIILSKKYNIPVCLIFYELTVTKTILELIQSLKWGSVIFLQNKEPFTSQMFEALKISSLTNDQKVLVNHYSYLNKFLSEDKTFYLSLFIEDRASSILEYHLEESKNNFLNILKVYYYLLSKNKANKTTFIKNLLDSVLDFSDGKIKFGNILKTSFFSSEVEALNELVQGMPKYLNSAIPDSVFEIANMERNIFPENYLNDQASDLQQNTKNIHTFFSNQVDKRPQGTLEIPTYYFNRVYVRYFCYSTEGDYWVKIFNSKNIGIKYGFDIHPLFRDKDYLENSNFVASFGLLV